MSKGYEKSWWGVTLVPVVCWDGPNCVIFPFGIFEDEVYFDALGRLNYWERDCSYDNAIFSLCKFYEKRGNRLKKRLLTSNKKG